MRIRLDREGGIPLYRQIIQALRWRIGTGGLHPGQQLPPLREAAKLWGVNYHTVRRAYKALQEEGLLETRVPGGTRVARTQVGGADPARAATLEAYVAAAAETAAERFGATPMELAEALGRLEVEGTGVRPRVWVVECSETLAESLAGQLGVHWAVEARGWALERMGELPEGPVVATYFHYNEVRRALASRLDDVRFVAIRPLLVGLEGLLERGEAERAPGRVILCETDEAMAHNIAVDLQAALASSDLQPEVRVEVPGVASDALEGVMSGDVVLFSPASWQQLDEAERLHPAAHELGYEIDAEDLERLGRAFGWR